MTPVFSHAILQALYMAAQKVLEEGASPELLREPLAELDEMVEFSESARGQEILEEARNLHIDYAHDIDIDDATVIYHNETDGYWVMGWCFVPDHHEEDEEEEQARDFPGNHIP